MSFTAAQIAEQIGGEVLGDGTVELTGLAPAEHARPGDLTFAENAAYFAAAEASQATAVLVTGDLPASKKVLVRVANARVAMAKALAIFFPPDGLPCGIHPDAAIADSAQIDPTAHIGPHCVVGARVRLGARSVLMGGNHLGRDCQIGSDVCLHPNVVIYAKTQIGHRVMPQVGHLVIHDDVEIGANAAIDRGALGATVIGPGTKIDNLVHVAHNVVLGRHCLIMGQVGFAGSTTLGDCCVVASQSGISGHLKLGNQVTIGAKSGVMRDIPDGGRVLGIPAAPDKQAKRQWVGVQQLPELIRRLRELEQEVAQLRAKVGE